MSKNQIGALIYAPLSLDITYLQRFGIPSVYHTDTKRQSFGLRRLDQIRLDQYSVVVYIQAKILYQIQYKNYTTDNLIFQPRCYIKQSRILLYLKCKNQITRYALWLDGRTQSLNYKKRLLTNRCTFSEHISSHLQTEQTEKIGQFAAFV